MLKKHSKSRLIEILKRGHQAKQYDQNWHWYRYHLAERLSGALSGSSLSTIQR